MHVFIFIFQVFHDFPGRWEPCFSASLPFAISQGGVLTRKMYIPARTAPRTQRYRYDLLKEVGQNGTLAVLAYVYCRQWECAPQGHIPCVTWMMAHQYVTSRFSGINRTVESTRWTVE